jgi:enoyl-CoA hydratase
LFTPPFDSEDPVADEIVQYELKEEIAVLRMDDGKANVVSHALTQALHAALDRAEKEAKAVLIIGRPGRFSAGFDLSVMSSGPEAVKELVTAGALVLTRLFTHPRPVVAACTGHALAAGALLLLASDLRVGVEGDFKIGLNEVAIGMTPPLFLLELANHRLTPRYLTRATTQAEIFAPESAVEVGYLDRVASADALFETCFAATARLGQLPDPAFRNAKERERGTRAQRIRDSLEADMTALRG